VGSVKGLMLFYVIHQEVRLLLEISSNICLVIYLLGGTENN
jgi:hypothetical protein